MPLFGNICQEISSDQELSANLHEQLLVNKHLSMSSLRKNFITKLVTYM